MIRTPRRDTISRAARASAGRKPGGPASISRRSRRIASSRTRSRAIWNPQPGTSQTPHEIGAAASLTGERVWTMRAEARIDARATPVCAQPYVRTLASEGDSGERRSRRMRLGLLGVGRLGAAHAATLRSLAGVDELRIYDADASRAREVAAKVNARQVDSVDAALEGVDAAVIVTPTDTHAPIIRRCLDAGIATFCEKPIAIAPRLPRCHDPSPRRGDPKTDAPYIKIFLRYEFTSRCHV